MQFPIDDVVSASGWEVEVHNMKYWRYRNGNKSNEEYYACKSKAC